MSPAALLHEYIGRAPPPAFLTTDHSRHTSPISLSPLYLTAPRVV